MQLDAPVERNLSPKGIFIQSSASLRLEKSLAHIVSEKTRVVGIVVKTKTARIVVSNGTEYLMYFVPWSTEGLKRNTNGIDVK